jgi:hypothetical protein
MTAPVLALILGFTFLTLALRERIAERLEGRNRILPP